MSMGETLLCPCGPHPIPSPRSLAVLESWPTTQLRPAHSTHTQQGPSAHKGPPVSFRQNVVALEPLGLLLPVVALLPLPLPPLPLDPTSEQAQEAFRAEPVATRTPPSHETIAGQPFLVDKELGTVKTHHPPPKLPSLARPSSHSPSGPSVKPSAAFISDTLSSLLVCQTSVRP